MISRTPCRPRPLRCLRKRAPARLVLLGALADAENLPITLAVHPDRHQQRHVADLTGPAALEHDAVQVDVGMLALDRPIAPGLDRAVDLLVQVRHRRRRHPRAPQRFRDVLDTANRDSRQIHLDQGLLDRALAPPVTLDDRRLEGLLAKLRYPQLYLAGLGLQLALVVAGSRIATGFAALVALRIAQPIRLGVQQSVQRLLHAPSNHAVEVALDPLIVNRDDMAQWTRCSLGHGGSFLLSWLRLATSSSARFGAASPYLFVRKILRHRQKPVTAAYRENWNAIFAKKPKSKKKR